MERTPTLAELQRWFRERLTGETRTGFDWIETVADVPPVLREDRITIYRNAYHWRLIEVLSDEFEATGRSVTWRWGYERWDELTRAFLGAHPSRSEDILEVGVPFVDFFKTRPEASELPWLVALARFERETTLSFLAPDPAPISAERLAGLAESGGTGVRFSLAPSVRLVECAWPVLGVWNRRKSPADPRFPKAPRRQWLRLGRAPGGGVLAVAEPEAAHRILSRLQSGETLDHACRDASDAAKVGAWFQRWMAEGVFAGWALDQ